MKFEVDDCEEPWTFREKFDLIHIRYLAAAIADWPKLISQAFQFTKPGGYSEFQDYDIVFYSEDGTLTDDRELSSNTMQTTSNRMIVPIQKWITTFIQAARDFGREPCPGPRLAGLMRDAGFQNVQEKKYKVPIGPWPKDKHLVRISQCRCSGYMWLNDSPENHRCVESCPDGKRPRGFHASAVYANTWMEKRGGACATCEREKGPEEPENPCAA